MKEHYIFESVTAFLFFYLGIVELQYYIHFRCITQSFEI